MYDAAKLPASTNALTFAVTSDLVEPVSLEQAKKHLNLQGVIDDNDDMIQSIITAAREMAEGKLNRTLVQRQLEVASSSWASIPLRKPPFVQVDSVSYIDAEGFEQTLEPESISVSTRTEPARVSLSPAFRQYAPQLAHQEEAVIVRYTAGYAPGEVPAPIIQWMLLAIGAIYENREAVTAGVQTYALPEDYMRWFLQPYMVYE